MKVAFGLKAHSGRAALVVLGKQRDELTVVDRRRIELVEERWAKQPYHAAEGLERQAARQLVKRGVDGAHRFALSEMKAAFGRERERNNQVVACAVLVGAPMPDWNTDEILAVHPGSYKHDWTLPPRHIPLKVPTKNGKKRWHSCSSTSTTLMRIASTRCSRGLQSEATNS